MRTVTVLALLGLLLAGCQEKRTQIMLGIATDFDAPSPLAGVRLQVFNLDRGDQAPAIENYWPITGKPNEPFELPGSFGLHSEDSSVLPRMRIVLTGVGPGNRGDLLTRTAVVKLVREKTLFMRMSLATSCATDADCPAAQTCVEARCRDQEIDASTLPEFREIMVSTIGCTAESAGTYVNTSTNAPMPMMGSGGCAADEYCLEGTCYKRPTGATFARDITIEGVVRDYRDQPVVDASIEAREGAINGPLLGKIVKSNERGEFRLFGTLPATAAEALVHVSQGDFAPQIMPVPVKPDQSVYRLPVIMPSLTLTPLGAGSTTITASPTVTITVPPTPGGVLARHAIVNPVRGPGRLRADGADPGSALQSVGMLYVDVVDARNEVVENVAARVRIGLPTPLPMVPMAGMFRVYRLGGQGLWTDAGPIQADQTGIEFTTTSAGFWDVNRTFPVACVRGRLRHQGGGCNGARVVAGSETVGVSGFDSSDAEGGFCVNGAPGVMSTLFVGKATPMVSFLPGTGSCAMPANCSDLGDLTIDQLDCEAAPSAAKGDAGDPCASTEACKPGLTCYNKFCVGAGKLRVSLAFTADTDLDLHLRTPLGNEISFANTSADGGELDVDQCSMGSCGTGEHVENIVFRDTLPSGTYQAWVVNFDPRAAATFTIDVAGAVTQRFTGQLPAEGAESMRFSFVVP